MTQETFDGLEFGDRVFVYHPGGATTKDIFLPYATDAIAIRLYKDEIRYYSKFSDEKVHFKNAYISKDELDKRFQEDMKMMEQKYRSLLRQATAAVQIEIIE